MGKSLVFQKHMLISSTMRKRLELAVALLPLAIGMMLGTLSMHRAEPAFKETTAILV